MINRMMPL